MSIFLQTQPLQICKSGLVGNVFFIKTLKPLKSCDFDIIPYPKYLSTGVYDSTTFVTR